MQMRRTMSCESGKFVLPRIVRSDSELSVTGTSSFSAKEGKNRKKTLGQGSFNRGDLSRDKPLAKVSEAVDIPRLTLPAIPLRTGQVNNEEKRRRGRIHCNYDFSLQVQRAVMPEWNKDNKSRKTSSSTSGSRGSDVPAGHLPFVIYDQNYGDNRKGEKSDLKSDRRNFLPPLEGQRMNLLEKEQLNKQRKELYKTSEKRRRKKHDPRQPLIWFCKARDTG